MRERAFHPWVTCVDGPLTGATLTVEWHWAVPPSGIWLTVDEDGGVVGLGPDKALLNAVADRYGSGGMGWLPYRCAEPEPRRDTGPDGAPIDVWVYQLDAVAAATIRPHRRSSEAVAGAGERRPAPGWRGGTPPRTGPSAPGDVASGPG